MAVAKNYDFHRDSVFSTKGSFGKPNQTVKTAKTVKQVLLCPFFRAVVCML